MPLGFQFQGLYLPWALIAFTVLVGGNPMMDIFGVIAGHLYYFLLEVLPETKGWNLIQTPSLLYVLATLSMCWSCKCRAYRVTHTLSMCVLSYDAQCQLVPIATSGWCDADHWRARTCWCCRSSRRWWLRMGHWSSTWAVDDDLVNKRAVSDREQDTSY